MWRLARRLLVDHSPGRDGFCIACREYWPCESRTIAGTGLERAVRRRQDGNLGGRFWTRP